MSVPEDPLLPAITFLKAPVALHERLALQYDFTYHQPVRQYAVEGRALEFVADAVAGRYERLSRLSSEEIARLPGMARAPLPAAFTNVPIDVAIIDGSLGGPSLWAGHVADYLMARGKRCLRASFHRAEFCIDDARIQGPQPWNKFTFTHWVRAMIQILKPRRLLVVGREIGAKLFDLFSATRATVLETGFAESSVIAEPVTPELLRRALSEVLFRADTYPWDSLAHAITAGACIRAAERNVLWSEAVFDTVRERFPDAPLTFLPPAVDTARFRGGGARYGGALRILLGAGAHSLGPSGRSFLAVEPLISAAARVPDCLVTILTSDTARLREAVGSQRHVRILPRVPWEQMPAVFGRHNLYYRVQNDSSLPTSCLEAMALGLPAIVNERATSAFRALNPGVNVLTVPFGDSAVLEELLGRLHEDSELRRRVGEAGSRLVQERCDLVANLRAIGWGS